MAIEVTELRVYPVKSFGVFQAERWEIEKRGLKWDRRWMVVDDAGQFLSQRNTPKMARCQQSIRHNILTLSFLDLPDFTLSPPSGPETMMVQVWSSRLRAIKCGADADAWVSQALGVSAHLVYMAENSRRPVRYPYGEKGEFTSFADAHPILVAGEESLQDLNDRMDSPVPINRFRPNIIIRGANAFQEDSWPRIKIGDVILRATKPCGRCSVTTLDHLTGESQSAEPLRTLATYRRVGSSVRFGMYYVPEVLGEIRVGDPVEVLP